MQEGMDVSKVNRPTGGASCSCSRLKLIPFSEHHLSDLDDVLTPASSFFVPPLPTHRHASSSEKVSRGVIPSQQEQLPRLGCTIFHFPERMPRSTSRKVSALSAVAATAALILDPSACSTNCYAFTPMASSGTAQHRILGPLHLSDETSASAGSSLVPLNSLHSSERRAAASHRVTSTSNHLASSRDRNMRMYAAKNKGVEIEPDYSNLQPRVYPQRWVQLAYLSLLALLVSFRHRICWKRCMAVWRVMCLKYEI